MVVREPAYKKWWLDFQGLHVYSYLCKKNSVYATAYGPRTKKLDGSCYKTSLLRIDEHRFSHVIFLQNLPSGKLT